MQIFFVTILAFVSSAGILQGAVPNAPLPENSAVQLLSSTSSLVAMRGDFTGITAQTTELNGQQLQEFSLPGEGTTFIPGLPLLPAVSRFVIVPPNANIELTYSTSQSRREKSDHLPLLCPVDTGMALPSIVHGGVFPEVIAEMSNPIVVRGVRLVKVTVYPVQYDFETGEFIRHDRIVTEVKTAPGEAINPVLVPDRRNRSRNFSKFLRSIAINGAEVVRDDPDEDSNAPATHYLAVMPENCLPFVRPFIEWRRKAGDQVDILIFSHQDAGNPGTVREAIQNLYDAYLNEGLDPFDQIFLVGDRESYANGDNPQWVLQSFAGRSNWGQADHADYLYACLEGNDEYPDVGIARWIAGTQTTLELACGRTLAYEASPFMDNPAWLSRAAAFSQHWGNGPDNEWHPSLHMGPRWAVEVLEHKGFQDVPFYELFEYDQNGNRFGPWLRDRFNQGASIMIGRAQNWYFRFELQGVNDNNVFPIYLTSANHSDIVGETLFRVGDRQHMKGVVAQSFTWGELGYTSDSYILNTLWAEMVKAVLIDDLPLGLARVSALMNIQRYIPNIQLFGIPIYELLKTDFDATGDPGIQPWIGVPRVIEAELTTPVEPTRRLFEVTVTDPEGVAVPGARVTFYAPGEIPQNNPDYADYDGFISLSTITDAEGRARFLFDPDVEFIENTRLFVTITGRDIKPFFIEETFRTPETAIEAVGFTLNNIAGNGDAVANPGEILGLTLTTQNLGEADLSDVIVTVTSLSRLVEVGGEREFAIAEIGAGESVETHTEVILTFDESCPDGSVNPLNRPELLIQYRWEGGTTRSAVRLDPVAPALTVAEIVGGEVIPDSLCNLNLLIENIGRMDSSPISARLFSYGQGVSIIEEGAAFPAINVGENAQIDGEPFQITGSQIIPPGTRQKLGLILEIESGWIDTISFELQIGRPRANAPMIPDKYGYICFDDSDEGWDFAPEYEWLEINPNEQDAEFDGSRLDFEGESPHYIGEAAVIDLPFETQFYGEMFDRITISTNGFIAMGDQTDIVSFQNYPLDRGIGGGAGMIAPFWTDLRMNDNSSVFTYNDDVEHRFIIEWSKMRGAGQGMQQDLTFQVILYDHAVWITESGDQEILFQYRQIDMWVNIRPNDREWGSAAPYPSVGISSPDGTSGISYTWGGEYPVANARIENRRAIKFATGFRYRGCTIYGWVTDAETHDPLEGVWVFTGHGFFTTTDENGYYRLGDALAEIPFPLNFRKQGYNDTTVVVPEGIPEGDSMEISVELLHPDFILSTQLVERQLEPGELSQDNFTITNTGNGLLEWTAEKRLPGDADADPWELRRSFNISQITDDERIEGVAFGEGKFFVSGANLQDSTLIYILDREGALLDSFPQVNSTRYGYKDLEWDGEYIWAVGVDTIYCLSTEGDVIADWPDPLTPSQYIAFNSERGVLYLAGTTSHIFACDREGNLLGEHIDPVALRQRRYGLGYWPADPDGFDLYILNKPGRDTTFVVKMDVETGDTSTVFQLPTSDGTLGYQSIYISNEIDIYSWVFICIENISSGQGGDKLHVFQLDGRKDWMLLNRNAGVLEAGQVQNMTLTLNTGDLAENSFYEGEILFRHNAEGGEAILAISLEVLPIPPRMPFELLFPRDGDTLNIFLNEIDSVHSGRVRFLWEEPNRQNNDRDFRYLIRFSTGRWSTFYPIADTFFTVNMDTVLPPVPINGNMLWSVDAISAADTFSCRVPFTLRVISLSTDRDPLVPVEFGLHSIYPNPFNATTAIRFGVEQRGWIALKAYDSAGRLAAVLFEGNSEAGLFRLQWDAEYLTAGVYLLRLEANGQTNVRKIALIR